MAENFPPSRHGLQKKTGRPTGQRKRQTAANERQTEEGVKAG